MTSKSSSSSPGVEVGGPSTWTDVVAAASVISVSSVVALVATFCALVPLIPLIMSTLVVLPAAEGFSTGADISTYVMFTSEAMVKYIQLKYIRNE